MGLRTVVEDTLVKNMLLVIQSKCVYYGMHYKMCGRDHLANSRKRSLANTSADDGGRRLMDAWNGG